MQVDAKIDPRLLEILREADRLQIKYKLNPSYPVAQIDPDRRVQVRTEHIAPAENVNSYANQMKAGVSFPAMMLTADGFIVDGNTRAKAYRVNKQPHAGVVVIQANYDGADPETRAKLHLLAAAANQKGAQRLKTKEAKLAVLEGITLGINNKRIMELCGVSNGAINKIRRAEAAKARMHALAMSPPNLANADHLGTPEMLALNDEPYRRLALLAIDADLSVRETKEIAKEIKKAGSDAAAIENLKQRRSALEDRIAAKTMTGEGKPSQAARFRQALGMLLGYAEKANEVLERNSTLAADHLAKIEEAHDFLDELRTKQNEIVKAIEAKAREVQSDEDEE